MVIELAALLFPLVADFCHTFSWLLCENDLWEAIQKQSSIGVLIKGCSKNMQQIYRRTNMLKSDFNKVALHNWVCIALFMTQNQKLIKFLKFFAFDNANSSFYLLYMYNVFIFDEKGVFYILTAFSSFMENVLINFEYKNLKRLIML